jgi:branched-chain amino acid transport system substrate-binding protein
MFDSSALTKIQSIVLVAVIVIASIGGGATYLLLTGQDQSSDTIKIGILADLDATLGGSAWQSAVLAAEQINAEGGILGRQIEVIGEDNDIETSLDVNTISSALTRLLTYHDVDFVLGQVDGQAAFVSQDIVADHEKILIAITGTSNELSQRVIDDYAKYKYYFRILFNATSVFLGMTDSLLLLRENTGFNKVGYLAEDSVINAGITEGLDSVLPDVHDFDLIYRGTFPPGTVDFSSYFAAAEEADVDVLIPLIWGIGSGISFVKEWYNRESPVLIYGGVLPGASTPESWDWTEGKCDNVITPAFPVVIGYPLTSKTLSMRDDYINRWGETPTAFAGFVYDVISFILPSAINRAGTIETDAVIEALEETSVETSGARNFVFTSSHDPLVGENLNDPEADYTLVMLSQWQNGEQVPVYPKKIMEEAGATYMFPDWLGPWD